MSVCVCAFFSHLCWFLWVNVSNAFCCMKLHTLTRAHRLDALQTSTLLHFIQIVYSKYHTRALEDPPAPKKATSSMKIMHFRYSNKIFFFVRRSNIWMVCMGRDCNNSFANWKFCLCYFTAFFLSYHNQFCIMERVWYGISTYDIETNNLASFKLIHFKSYTIQQFWKPFTKRYWHAITNQCRKKSSTRLFNSYMKVIC